MSCKTCDMVARRDGGDAPPWDNIVRTPEWDVVHAYDTSHEGWLVIVLRRHVTSLSEMTDHEAAELGRLTRDVSAALEHVLGVPRTYVVQFAEHPLHPHVHVHLVARPEDLPKEQRGPGIFTKLGVIKSARVPEERMNEIALAVREQLTES